MKKIVIYTLISFIFSVFASSCEDNKDNSLYYPDFTWDTGCLLYTSDAADE